MDRQIVVLLILAGCSSDGGDSLDLSVDDLKSVDLASVDLNGGACQPAAVPGFVASWQPPAQAHAGRCSSNEITMGVRALVQGGLVTFAGMHPDCAACLITDSRSATLGAMVEFNAYGVVDGNSAGCVAILTGDAGAASCAAKSQAQYRCTLASCAPGCPVKTQQDLVQFDACVTSASQPAGPCAAYATDCLMSATVTADGGDSIDQCFLREQGVTAWFTYLATLFCG